MRLGVHYANFTHPDWEHRLTERLRVEGGNIGYGVRPSARRRGHATEILRRTLEEARAVGLDEVLLTCAKDNPGSIGTILKCGGRYADEAFAQYDAELRGSDTDGW